MPLTEKQKLLLFEIYECPSEDTPNMVVSPGSGVSVFPNYIDAVSSVRTLLVNAIIRINSDEDRVARVGEILEEYENFALDPSPISRDGYEFTAGRGQRAVWKALQPLTGIIMNPGTSGQIMRLG